MKTKPEFKITQKGNRYYLWKSTTQGKSLVTIDTRKEVIYNYAVSLIKGS